MSANTPERAHWKSRFGFILAASGSAIGLGNIVFFPANAYKFGGGAFYLPYLIALFVMSWRLTLYVLVPIPFILIWGVVFWKRMRVCSA